MVMGRGSCSENSAEIAGLVSMGCRREGGGGALWKDDSGKLQWSCQMLQPGERRKKGTAGRRRRLCVVSTLHLLGSASRCVEKKND